MCFTVAVRGFGGELERGKRPVRRARPSTIGLWQQCEEFVERFLELRGGELEELFVDLANGADR
jgi:hypothetical protein